MKFIYLIHLEGTDIYKIGFSKTPNKRVKGLQTGNPYKLLVVDSYESKRATKIETVLHSRFAAHKIDENEYHLMGEFFKLDFETKSKFREMCKKIDDNFQVLEDHSTLYDQKSSFGL